MVKNTLISVISEEENRRSIEFQVFQFTNNYGDLLSIWNCTKKTIYLREVCKIFWKNLNGCWLSWEKKQSTS